ncbi:hypothetical protein [Brevundimonas sp.]|uniref:hypothetical protein n=1 Tax=Brevundimonas sp. TaxID=1871086 RepID=UPI00356ADC19
MLLAASITGALLAGGLSLHEETSTAFRLFRDVCLASDGDRSRIIDAAGENGFAIQVGVRPRAFGRLTNAVMLPWTGDEMKTALFIGWRGPLLSCVITSRRGDQPDFTEDVESWTGFEADPARVSGSVTNYFFTQTERGRESIGDATPEQQSAFLADGSFRVLWTSRTDEAVTLSFTAPPKGDAPTSTASE